MSALPEAYLAYVKNGGALTGLIAGRPGRFKLWPLSQLKAENEELHVAQLAPGYIGFGHNGDGEMLAFDGAGAVCVIPLVGMSGHDTKQIAPSWPEFARLIRRETKGASTVKPPHWRLRAILLLLVLLALVGAWLAPQRPGAVAKLSLAPPAPRQPEKVEIPRDAPRAVEQPAAAESQPIRPVASWRNVGNGTPRAAFESVFWAKEHLDTITLATLIGVSPNVRARADEIFTAMSPLVRSRLSIHSPEQLVAFLYASSPLIDGFRIRAETLKDHEHATVTGDLQFATGSTATVDFHFRTELGGWRYVLDEENARSVLDRWEDYLAAGEKRKGPTSR